MAEITLGNINTNNNISEFVEAKNEQNLKRTWLNRTDHVRGATAADVFPEIGGDPEYLELWKEHFGDFNGKILEIGAGTGFLAKNILKINEDVQYSILDIERNFEFIKETLFDSPEVEYIKSSEYKNVFNQEWDVLIATHCLSETPRYYYTDILDNVSVKACFVVDYGGDPNDPGFEQSLTEWFAKFPNGERLLNQKLLGASKIGGMPVYIGKPA